eukprot:SAG31_NODE_8067_length_1529_cov_1.584615_3_plen_91_part_00
MNAQRFAAVCLLLIAFTAHVRRLLGTGSFAEVRQGTAPDGTACAIKVYSKARMQKKRMGLRKPSMLEKVGEEIAIMKKIDHPHVVRSVPN